MVKKRSAIVEELHYNECSCLVASPTREQLTLLAHQHQYSGALVELFLELYLGQFVFVIFVHPCRLDGLQNATILVE